MQTRALLKKPENIILLALLVLTISCNSTDRRAAIYELPDWQQVSVLGPGYLRHITYAPKGDKVAICTTRSIEIWDATTWQMERELLGGVRTAAWSPDGSQLVSGAHAHTVKIWDVPTGRVLRTLTGHHCWITGVWWSPDARTIVSQDHDDNIFIWDAQTGTRLRSDSSRGRWPAVESPLPGTRLDTGSGSTIIMWDARTGETVKRFKAPTPGVSVITWSPDGRTLVGGSSRAIHLWDIESGALIKSLTREQVAMGHVAWSPDLSKIAGNDSLLIINGQIAESPVGNVVRMGGERPIGWSPDGHKMAIGGGFIHISDAHTGTEITNFRSPSSFTIAAAWSPDSRQMAVASNRGSICVYDTQNGQPVQELHGFQESVRSIAWSPDATRIVASSHSHAIKIWDVRSGSVRQTLTERAAWFDSLWWDFAYGCPGTAAIHDPGCMVAWSPDGRKVVSSSLDTITIWDARTGKTLRQWSERKSAGVRSLAWSPDSRSLASTDLNTIRLWNVETGRFIGTLTGHTEKVTRIVWSPDSGWIISGSEDGTVRVWGPKK